ncbi:MAG: IS110 family transposase [Actinobacteria bacterium]|nr:IS110 family transposase [Actinomycetota bacterium]
MFAGIDWGGHRHQLAIVDDDGRVLVNDRFTHDRAGVDELLTTLQTHQDSGPMAVAIERCDGIVVEALQANGHPVYPLSPRVSARARERYQAAHRKDDRFDAFVLADTLRHEHARWRPLARPSDTLAELRVLVRDRRRTLETQQAVEAQLRATLEAYHPAAVRLFSSIDRAITLAFVRDYPTPEAAARIGPRRMQAFLARHGYTGRVPAEALVERLRTHLLAATPGTSAGHQFSALALADHLELLNLQLKRFDAAVADVFARHPDGPIFASFPGVGPVISAALLAEIGEDRSRFPTAAVLLAEAGLAPVTLASGKVRRVRLRRACNTRLRDTFNWWAYTLKRIDQPTRLVYLAALDQGQHSHRALRGIGARWARVLWRCWQDGVPFDPTRRATT